MAYAEIEDVVAKWGDLGEREQLAEALLDDASLYIDALVERFGVDPEAKAAALKALAVDYVHHVVDTEQDARLSTLTHQAGSFMETQTFRNRQKGFDEFARDYYSVLGLSRAGVCFAFPGAPR